MDDSGRDTPLLAGRYRLDEPVGRDRIAEVWRGCDLATGRPVTIKLLTGGKGPAEGSEGRVRPRWRPRVTRRAGRSAGGRVLDVGEQDGRAFVVLTPDEAAAGGSVLQGHPAEFPSPHVGPYGDVFGHEGWPTRRDRPGGPDDSRDARSNEGPDDPSASEPGATSPAAGHPAAGVAPAADSGVMADADRDLSPSVARTTRSRRVGVVIAQSVAGVVLIGSAIWLVASVTPPRPGTTAPPRAAAPSASPAFAAPDTASPTAVPAPSASARTTAGPSARPTPPAREPVARPTAARSARPSAGPSRDRADARSAGDQSSGRGGAPKRSPESPKYSDDGPKIPNGKGRHPPGKAKGWDRTPPGLAKTPPGLAKTPPGLAKTPPGLAKTPPGLAR